jgi:hypothetical protein
MNRDDYHRAIIHATDVLAALMPPHRMRACGIPDEAVRLTAQAYDKLWWAQLLIEGQDRSTVALDDAMHVLRRVEQDLDLYGELTISTVTALRALFERLDGAPEPADERPF